MTTYIKKQASFLCTSLSPITLKQSDKIEKNPLNLLYYFEQKLAALIE